MASATKRTRSHPHSPLVDLPVSTLEKIIKGLSWTDVTRLWCAGDEKLRWQMADYGIVAAEVYPTSETPFEALSALLQRLKALRSLKVVASDDVALRGNECLQLETLPRMMFRLEIVRVRLTGADRFNFRMALPCLQQLVLTEPLALSKEWCSMLPVQLKMLDLEVMTANASEFCEALPKGLVELRLKFWQSRSSPAAVAVSLAHFPPGLHSLKLLHGYVRDEDWKQQVEAITDEQFSKGSPRARRRGPRKRAPDLECVPASSRALNLVLPELRSLVYPLETLKVENTLETSCLGARLRLLDLGDSTMHLSLDTGRLLPSSLTSLSGQFATIHPEAYRELPRSLVTLMVPSSTTPTRKDVRSLPRGLARLTASCIHFADLASLPICLLHLSSPIDYSSYDLRFYDNEAAIDLDAGVKFNGQKQQTPDWSRTPGSDAAPQVLDDHWLSSPASDSLDPWPLFHFINDIDGAVAFPPNLVTWENGTYPMSWIDLMSAESCSSSIETDSESTNDGFFMDELVDFVCPGSQDRQQPYEDLSLSHFHHQSLPDIFPISLTEITIATGSLESLCHFPAHLRSLKLDISFSSHHEAMSVCPCQRKLRATADRYVHCDGRGRERLGRMALTHDEGEDGEDQDGTDEIENSCTAWSKRLPSSLELLSLVSAGAGQLSPCVIRSLPCSLSSLSITCTQPLLPINDECMFELPARLVEMCYFWVPREGHEMWPFLAFPSGLQSLTLQHAASKIELHGSRTTSLSAREVNVVEVSTEELNLIPSTCSRLSIPKPTSEDAQRWILRRSQR